MTNEQKQENRLVMKLQAALAAADDRLSELLATPENDAVVLLLRAAILDAESFFPPSDYTGRSLAEMEKAAC
jgi:hypothetical protein